MHITLDGSVPCKIYFSGGGKYAIEKEVSSSAYAKDKQQIHSKITRKTEEM